MLFGEEEPGASDGQSDPLIPAQDLTRVGTPCWRLGDLFGEREIEGLGLEDDPVIPAQDVGLDNFDDMPGFALAENHFMAQDDTPLVYTAQNPPRIPTKQDPSRAASASVLGVSHLRQDRRRTSKGVLTSLTTGYPFHSLLSYTAAQFTRSADDSPFSSLGGGMEALGRLLLAVLLVIAYECVGVYGYSYLKKLPPPPRFLWRLGLLVLLVCRLFATSLQWDCGSYNESAVVL